MTQIGLEELKDIVVRHHICWDVVPLLARTTDDVRAVGYEVHLLGIHETPHADIRPGCIHCRNVFQDISTVAKSVLPEPGRPSKYEITLFDGALRYAANEKLPAAVRVVIEIRHRLEWEAPIDDCEKNCLGEITKKLSDLGAPQRRWPTP